MRCRASNQREKASDQPHRDCSDAPLQKADWPVKPNPTTKPLHGLRLSLFSQFRRNSENPESKIRKRCSAREEARRTEGRGGGEGRVKRRGKGRKGREGGQQARLFEISLQQLGMRLRCRRAKPGAQGGRDRSW